MRPDVHSRRAAIWGFAAFLAAALVLAVGLAPRAVAGGCAEDAAGMCERPIACNPPQGGRCTTVAIPQPLTGHKFECRCLAPKTSSTIGGNGPVGGTIGGATGPGQCQQKCQIARGQCVQRASNPALRDSCDMQFQRCEQSCQGMH
jgi:hypothetical protein